MQIVVYTPPYQADGKFYTYVPHLVEHCVGRPANISQKYYFKYTTEIEAEFLINFSIYTYSPNKISTNEVIHILSQPLDEYIIDHEKRIIAQEIKEYDNKENSIQKTLEHVLYNGTYIEDEKPSISNSKIIAYHQKHYNPNLFITSDSSFKLNLPETLLEGISDIYTGIYTGAIEFCGAQGTYIYGTNRNWKTYYTLLFIKELLKEFTRFAVRYREMSDFDYPEIERFMSLHHRCIVFPNSISIDISKSFFEEYKKYFIRSLFTDYDTSEFCYYNLIHSGIITKEIIISYIDTIEYETIIKTIKKGVV